jgi:hypothetical protein
MMAEPMLPAPIKPSFMIHASRLQFIYKHNLL